MNASYKFICTVLFTFFLLSTLASFAQEDEEETEPTTIEELKSAIEKLLKDDRTPGVGLVLINADSSTLITSLGKADITNDIAADENTMFRIGSTSKMFVSLAILKLQQEGRVSLKDKVRDLIPEIKYENRWSETSPILVEHLLEHTTGWDDIHLSEYAHNEPEPISLKEGLDYHPHSRISRWIPGTRMSYCNSGPGVAAYIVEKISGQAFEDYIQENFFQPMEMENMTYFATEKYKELGANLYTHGEAHDYWNIIVRPSGAINASPKDMAKMLKFFINRGRIDSLQLISEESLKRMETPVSTIGSRAGLEEGYGLSNYSSPHESFTYRSHNGGVSGGLTDFSYNPDFNMGYVVMINSSSGSTLSKITNLIRDYQTKDLVAKSSERDTTTNIETIDLSGYYIAINPRMQMSYFLERMFGVQKLWHEDGKLFKQSLFGGHIAKYFPVEENLYRSVKSGGLSLVQTEDPLAGKVVQANSSVLKANSMLLVFGQIAIAGLWALMVITSLLLGIIWLIRFWMSKIDGGSNLWIRMLPIIGSLLFFAFIIAVTIGSGNPFELLGKASYVSVSIMILTICFALLSFGSSFYIFLKRATNIPRFPFWFSAILTGLHVIVTCYFLWHGVIGIRVWV